MTVTELAAAYLGALEGGDLEAIRELFTPNAVVHSPLYGVVPAAEFYPRLFADTDRSTLTLLGALEGRSDTGVRLVGLWFHFDWRLSSGRSAPFDVVDVAELAGAGLITSLRIIYDTAPIRPIFEASTGSRPSSSRH